MKGGREMLNFHTFIFTFPHNFTAVVNQLMPNIKQLKLPRLFNAVSLGGGGETIYLCNKTYTVLIKAQA